MARQKDEQGKGGLWEIDQDFVINEPDEDDDPDEAVFEPPPPPPPRRKRGASKKNTKIQAEFTATEGQEELLPNDACSPMIPSSANTSNNEMKLTFDLPEDSETSPLPSSDTSSSPGPLPLLTLYKYNLIQNLISPAYNLVTASITTEEDIVDSTNVTIEEIQPVEAILKSLTPVSLEKLPQHLLETHLPPPALIQSQQLPPLLLHRERIRSVSVPSPSLTSQDDEILESLCSPGLDLPLYQHNISDWSKLEAADQESTNEEAASESSYLDQSWDETQTLPLFEPTLDFDTLMNY